MRIPLEIARNTLPRGPRCLLQIPRNDYFINLKSPEEGKIYMCLNQIPSGKLTWQWNMDLLKMYFLLK